MPMRKKANAFRIALLNKISMHNCANALLFERATPFAFQKILLARPFIYLSFYEPLFVGHLLEKRVRDACKRYAIAQNIETQLIKITDVCAR